MTLKAQAIVLAAGRGERMRPLTDLVPKPLLQVKGKPLIQWPLEALRQGGFSPVVVNTAWLGNQLVEALGDQVTYSHEGRDFGGALETAGGIVRALPQLDGVFWVVAGDVFAREFKFTQAAVDRFAASGKFAHLWLVANPVHNLRGDFGLSESGLALNLPKHSNALRYTYSTVGLYRQEFFRPPYCVIPSGNPQGVKAPLAPLLRAGMDNQQISAEIYTGPWTDVGTPERLAELNR